MYGNPVSGQKCPRCAKNSLLNDDVTGERFCGKCGYVISEKAQESEQEVGSFTQDEYGNKTKVPTSPTMHDIGSSTIINPINKDASGKLLSASMKNTIERLRTQDNSTQTHSSADKNFKQALKEMNKLKDKLALSEAVIENAIHLYQKAMEKKLARGYSINGLVGACLYASCKDTETPRTLEEIANSINMVEKEIRKCYKLIVRELELRIPVLDPKIHVHRIASMVGVSEKSKRKAITILEQAKKAGIGIGKEPMGVIAGALYLACIRTNEGKTQKEIANTSGVTEVTIRKRCKELSKIA